MIMIFAGILIGALVSLPIGPLGIICTQKTINMGRKVGFMAGIGAALSDMVFSISAIFGVHFIADFINNHIYFINGITGFIILTVGIKIFINPIDDNELEEKRNSEKLHPTLSTFLFGMSNPFTFLIFLTIFAKMDLELNHHTFVDNVLLVISIFFGAIIFWLIASKLIHHSKKNYKLETFYLINKSLGFILAMIGTYSIGTGILGNIL